MINIDHLATWAAGQYPHESDLAVKVMQRVMNYVRDNPEVMDSNPSYSDLSRWATANSLPGKVR